MRVLTWNNREKNGKWIENERNPFHFPLEVDCLHWKENKPEESNLKESRGKKKGKREKVM